ncbi:hypothetical protein EON65_02370 [archaeon]|nr:MAG: hypothetical protein EON65_02370 [archaeon]
MSRPNSTAGTAATTAVAGVPELSEASQIQEYNLLYCNSKDVNAPAYVSIYKDLNSTALAPSTIVPPSRPDCLVGLLTEISLGHGGQDLTGESSLLTGQYDVTQVTSSSVDWKVASGMDCQTVMWPATREESVVTRCELQVLGNGSLFLEMFAEKTDVCERKRLVSVALCLAVSTNPTSSEEGLSKSESVHMT